MSNDGFRYGPPYTRTPGYIKWGIASCPTCGARSGRPCMTRDGWEARRRHAARPTDEQVWAEPIPDHIWDEVEKIERERYYTPSY